jgi:hypothetical protein
VIRPIAVLVAAILMTRPAMPKQELRRYATVLNEVAAQKSFDPLLAVAVIHFESGWLPATISADGEDYGLGQVRARYLSSCRGDEDPLNAPSEGCQRAKTELLDGVTNIRRMGWIIGANMEFCKAKTGSPSPEHWLSGYQGYGDLERGKFCIPGEKTYRVLSYYDELVNKLAPTKKSKAKAKASVAGHNKPVAAHASKH